MVGDIYIMGLPNIIYTQTIYSDFEPFWIQVTFLRTQDNKEINYKGDKYKMRFPECVKNCVL